MSNISTKNIAFIGHIDHGKSSLIGRLIYETGNLNSLQEKTIKHGEWAHISDALKNEQQKKITTAMARLHLSYSSQHYALFDVPGHRHLVEHMLYGIWNIDAAILVVDVNEGIKEQTELHCAILALFGVHSIIVAVNKIDAAGYSQKAFEKVNQDIQAMLTKHNISTASIGTIPISAKNGDNIKNKSQSTQWYTGASLTDMLEDRVKEKKTQNASSDLRLPIQMVYSKNDNNVALGKIVDGSMQEGDKVIVLPQNTPTTIEKILSFDSTHIKRNKSAFIAGQSIGLTTKEAIPLRRGSQIVAVQHKLQQNDMINAQILWLSHDPLSSNHDYTLQIFTASMDVAIALRDRKAQPLKKYSIALIEMKIKGKYWFKENDRFIIRHNNIIMGVGKINNSRGHDV